MKKTYISPDTSLVLVGIQPILTQSDGNPDGFDGNLGDDNGGGGGEGIGVGDMLSRRGHSIWDDED